MYIDWLEAEGFRNYVKSSASFSQGVNVITGGNAQGKTNLLEAIYLVCTGRSFRCRSDKELIGFDKDAAWVTASGEASGRPRRVEIRLRRGFRRSVRANGVSVKTAAQLSGGFSAVLFSPQDLELIRGGAAERRRMMDMCLCQLRPKYAAALREFNRAWTGKTRILRDSRQKPSLAALLPEYDQRICEMSAVIIRYRARFLERLSPEAAKIHSQFSGGEKLGMIYKTVSSVKDPAASAEAIYGQLMDHLESHRQAEMASGMCLTGAHRDDVEITVNGVAARGFASQGQARTGALSIKLAEREMHLNCFGEYPILLLDDVLSELDTRRQDFILNRIGGGQVFITCCEDEGIAGRTGGRVLTVSQGQVLQ